MLRTKESRQEHRKYIVGSIKVNIPAQLRELKRADSQVISLYIRGYFYKNVFFCISRL